jgi:hypothetical protein
MSQNCGHQLAYCSSQVICEHGEPWWWWFRLGITPDSSTRALWQLYQQRHLGQVGVLNQVTAFHSTPYVMVIQPWLGLLELGSGISSTPDILVIPPWLGLLELGSGISSTPDVMVIPPWLGVLKIGSNISSTQDKTVPLTGLSLTSQFTAVREL